MTLEVRPPEATYVVINQRPLVGGGEEPLLLAYFDLKTVGGLLHIIQNLIPELSAESYGTKWVLYDPASGHYFHDIVRGDSRALQAAGIATKEGDTFLDLRPPKVEKPTTPKVQLGFAVGFGIVGLAVILIIAIFIPVPTDFQYQVFRIILALAAGGAASMIPGILNLQISNLITAGGALAVFVVVYFYSPAQLAVRGIAPNPTATPAASAELENWRNRWQTWRNVNYKAELRNQRLDPNLPPRIYIETPYLFDKFLAAPSIRWRVSITAGTGQREARPNAAVPPRRRDPKACLSAFGDNPVRVLVPLLEFNQP